MKLCLAVCLAVEELGHQHATDLLVEKGINARQSLAHQPIYRPQRVLEDPSYNR